jgi:Neuraminidase (sialidase)
MFSRAAPLLFAISLSAQTPLENTGKPMHVVYECTAADTQAAGIGCSEEDPCPVYLELANVDSVAGKIFATGNLHTPMATLYAILLASDDAGKTWTEPHERIRQSGLDQIQFVDSQHGWISGSNLQGSPRDPFFLITADGGKTWRERPIFDDTRVAAIERFWFESPMKGTLLVDARLDNGKREFYRTEDGGETWLSAEGPAKERQPSQPEWRVRTDAATHSYTVERSENNHWQKIASFLVNIASCKE